jgi:outer membrane protein OmpA-like peptidoglycan-associated protein
MVEPARPFHLAVLLGTATLVCGCALVPKEQLEECRKLSQSLQTQTAQLKDESLRLRAHNQDLSNRALVDARRIQTLEEANERLERSVVAYQEERDRLQAAFEQIKRQIAASIDRLPTAMIQRFEEFVRAHPGCDFDARTAVASIPVDLLFQPTSDQWQPAGKSLLEDLAKLLSETDVRDLRIEVAHASTSSQVRHASLEDAGRQLEELGRKRAKRVRDLLAAQAGSTGAEIETIVQQAHAQDVVDNANGLPVGRIEIHLSHFETPMVPRSQLPDNP